METYSNECGIYDSINDVLNGTKWQLMSPGSPKKIKIPEYSYSDVGSIMNYYRSAGWIVKATIMIESGKRTYTLEFVNPHHM
jgi:hypothetical protein